MIKKLLKWIGLALILLIGYLLAWPIPINPVSWKAPKSAGYVGDFKPNDALARLKFFKLQGKIGPEDVAIDANGMAYAATHDGDIIRIDPASGESSVFANTGGRPLGLEFGPDGTLYAADAYRGLVAIDKSGKVKVVTNKTDDGSTINYADDLDVTSTGVVYFSDASTKFGAKQYSGTLQGSLLDLMEHGPNGRILKYDPTNGKTTIVVDGYSFANGVALAKDESYFLFVETGTYSLHKYWLKGDKAGKVETLLRNLPGFPDNVNDDPDGTFWLGLVSPRSDPVDALGEKPFVRKIVQRLPAQLRPKPQRYGFVVHIDGDGKIIETLQDPAGKYALTTGAITLSDGRIIITSLSEPRLGIYTRP